MYVRRDGQKFTFNDPIDQQEWEHTFPDDREITDKALIDWRASNDPIIFYVPHLSEEEVAAFTFGVTPEHFKEYLVPTT